MMIVMFIIGLNQGSQPIIGFNYGAKNYHRMFDTLKLAAIIATGFSTIGFIIGTFFPFQAVTLFTTDKELIQLAGTAQRITVVLFPIIGFQTVVSNFFQSIGKAKLSIFLSLTRQFIFLIPSILILPPLLGLNGAWASMPVSDGLSSIVTLITFWIFYKNFKKKQIA